MKTSIQIRVYNDLSFDGSSLKPKDFIYCDTINDLTTAIRHKIVPTDKVDYTHVVSEKITIDPDFLEKWKELVHFIPKNVMTERRAAERKAESEYQEKFPGCILNRYKHQWSWDKFDLSYYNDFCFSDDKDYNCWLKDVDHYDNTTTILMYCEEVS